MSVDMRGTKEMQRFAPFDMFALDRAPRVLTCDLPDAEEVVVRLVVPGGAAADPVPGRASLAAAVRGNRLRAAAIESSLDGETAGVRCTHEEWVATVRGPRERLGDCVRLVANAVHDPLVLDGAEFAAARLARLDELAAWEANPVHHGARLLAAACFGESSPFARPAQGDRAVVAGLTGLPVSPSRAGGESIVLAGDLYGLDLGGAVADAFQLDPAECDGTPWPVAAVRAGSVVIAESPGPEGAVLLGRPVPRLTRAEYPAAWALAELLGAALTAERAGFRSVPSGAWFRLVLPARRGAEHAVLDQARTTLREVRTGRFAGIWPTGKPGWLTQFAAAGRLPARAASWVAYAWKHGLDPDWLAGQSLVDSAELADGVRRLADRLLDPDELAAVVLTAGGGDPAAPTPGTGPRQAGDDVLVWRN